VTEERQRDPSGERDAEHDEESFHGFHSASAEPPQGG
jgi:hypothetical protein